VLGTPEDAALYRILSQIVRGPQIFARQEISSGDIVIIVHSEIDLLVIRQGLSIGNSKGRQRECS
jgi:hypothetical protein